MDKKNFKELFFRIAKKYDFVYNYGVLYFDKPKMILVLNLQKSNYSELYYCNIELGVRGWYNDEIKINKESFKSFSGPIRERAIGEFHHIFDLENDLTDTKREKLLIQFFEDRIAYLKTLMDDVNDLIKAKNERKIKIPEIGFNELLKLKEV